MTCFDESELKSIFTCYRANVKRQPGTNLAVKKIPIIRMNEMLLKNTPQLNQEIVFEVITRNFKGIVLYSINEVQLGYPLHFL